MIYSNIKQKNDHMYLGKWIAHGKCLVHLIRDIKPVCLQKELSQETVSQYVIVCLKMWCRSWRLHEMMTSTGYTSQWPITRNAGKFLQGEKLLFVSAICIRKFAEEISITTSYSTGANIYSGDWRRFLLKVHFVTQYMIDRLSITVCCETVANVDECRDSIVNYRSPYHWLRVNYKSKTTFGTNRMRRTESATASTITWEGRQPALRRTKVICVSAWLKNLAISTVDVWKWGTRVSFLIFLIL